MQGTRIHVIALAAALAVGGCGGGGNDVAVKTSKPAVGSTSAAASPTATTPAEAKKPGHRAQPTPAQSKRKAHAQSGKKTVRPAAPKIPADIQRAKQIARGQGRSMVAIAKLCTPPANAPKPPTLPRSTSQMPRYARAVLPIVRRNAQQLRTLRTPRARRMLGSLAMLYDSALQGLQAIGDPSASAQLVKALAPPTARQVMALHTAAIGMGAPHCALPV